MSVWFVVALATFISFAIAIARMRPWTEGRTVAIVLSTCVFFLTLAFIARILHPARSLVLSESEARDLEAATRRELPGAFDEMDVRARAASPFVAGLRASGFFETEGPLADSTLLLGNGPKVAIVTSPRTSAFPTVPTMPDEVWNASAIEELIAPLRRIGGSPIDGSCDADGCRIEVGGRTTLVVTAGERRDRTLADRCRPARIVQRLESVLREIAATHTPAYQLRLKSPVGGFIDPFEVDAYAVFVVASDAELELLSEWQSDFESAEKRSFGIAPPFAEHIAPECRIPSEPDGE